HLRRALGRNAPRAGDAARAGAGTFGQRARRAVRDVAAGSHEASRRIVRSRTGEAKQDRPHGCLPARSRADARRFRVAQSLRKILARRVFEPGPFAGGRVMAVQTATKPSLTLKRRLNAPPAKVFAAWTDPEKVKGWMGPGEVKVLKVECEPRTG